MTIELAPAYIPVCGCQYQMFDKNCSVHWQIEPHHLHAVVSLMFSCLHLFKSIPDFFLCVCVCSSF